MAHLLENDIEEKHEKPSFAARTATATQTITKTKLPPLVDALTLYAIATLYFFFTGLAILFRSPLPRGWISLATRLSGGKLARKVQEIAVQQEKIERPKPKLRIVDLEDRKRALWSSPDEPMKN